MSFIIDKTHYCTSTAMLKVQHFTGLEPQNSQTPLTTNLKLLSRFSVSKQLIQRYAYLLFILLSLALASLTGWKLVSHDGGQESSDKKIALRRSEAMRVERMAHFVFVFFFLFVFRFFFWNGTNFRSVPPGLLPPPKQLCLKINCL
jgi:hypothetical protein